MSYILDALRKSEHERRVGAVPTLENAPFDTAEKSSQKPWIFILIAVLICLNIGTLLVITVFDQEDATPSVDTTDEAASDEEKTHTLLGQPKHSGLVSNQNNAAQPSTMSTPEKTPKPQPKEFASPQPITRIVALPTAQTTSVARPRTKADSQHTAKPTPTASKTKVVNPSKFSSNGQTTAAIPALTAPTPPQTQPKLVPSPPQSQQSNLPAEGNRKTVAKPTITPPKPIAAAVTPPQPRSVTTPNTDRKTSLGLPTPEPKSNVATAAPITPSNLPKRSNTHRTTTVQPKPPATESHDTSIPLLNNMARDFQRQIPDLNINVFVYSEVPEERFVIINMVKYKNGQKLRDGPLLGEIRSDSVVLNYRGRDFRLSRP